MGHNNLVRRYMHVGYPVAGLEEPLHRFFNSSKEITHFNPSSAELPKEIASCLLNDVLKTRRHLYDPRPVESILLKPFDAAEEKSDVKAVGFSFPNFFLSEPNEVDLLTRAQRLYDALSFGIYIVFIVQNQVDFICERYVQLHAAGAFKGSLDEYANQILDEPHYGLSIDLKYGDNFKLMGDIFGYQNIIFFLAESLQKQNYREGCAFKRKLLQNPMEEDSSIEFVDKHGDDYYRNLFEVNKTPALPAVDAGIELRLRKHFAPSNQILKKIIDDYHVFSQNLRVASQMEQHGYPL